MQTIKLKDNVISICDVEIKEYYEINKEIKRLEDIKRVLGDNIKKFMENNESNIYKNRFNTVSINTVSRKTLDKELLIEMGITEETLELCSKETVYKQLIIK